MKQHILVTGIAGSGKSTVCQVLRSRGYEAYDIESIPGMFAMYRKGTKELFVDFDNSDPTKIRESEWLCDIKELRKFLDHQHSQLAFYCGVASNMDDLIPLFDQVLLLQASSESIHERLSNREGSDYMGNTEASRQTILGWKDWWENEMQKRGATCVNAAGDPEVVASLIIEAVAPK